MINEIIKARGKLDILLTGPDGAIKQAKHIPNLVVTVGKEWIASRMKDVGIPGEMVAMAVGTDNTATDLAQDDLLSEIARVTLATAGGSVTDAVVTYEATFPAGTGTGGITEAGIFNNTNDGPASGIMLCRTVFDVVNKGADDTLSITWTVTIS